MEKTKLGVSVELLAAAVCFCALFGGYTPTLLLVGYILLLEQDAWLKKVAIKVVALLMAFSVFVYVIDLIPDLLSWVSSFLGLISLNISFSFIRGLFGLLTSAISIVKIICFLALGWKALKKETVAISSIDNLIDKHMGTAVDLEK